MGCFDRNILKNPFMMTHPYPDHRPINTWAEEERPREKLLQRGVEALTNIELIALLLATGTRQRTATDLAREVLEASGGLQQLARISVSELMNIRGIGRAKALTLVAAFELGRRKDVIQDVDIRLSSSEVVAQYLLPRLRDKEQEVFYVLFLNRNNTLKAEKEFFRGGVSATVIDTRLIFKEAVHQLASALILAHNHPSGSLSPSQADIEVTRKLSEAGKIFDIQVLDHLIISTQGYYSFADHGMM